MTDANKHGPQVGSRLVPGLLDAIVAVGSELDLVVVLHRIIEAAAALVDAEYGALGVIGDHEVLTQFITVGIDEADRLKIGPLPTGKGVLGLLIREPHALRLSNLSDHPVSFGFPPNHPPMSSFLGVPIRVRNEVFGHLYLTEKRGGVAFDSADETVVVALAAVAGVAVANARLYDEADKRERWLKASAEVTTTLLSGSNSGDALTIIARHARETAEGIASFVVLPGPDESLVVKFADGVAADRLRGLTIDIEGSLLGRSFQTTAPITVPTLPDDDPISLALDGAVGPTMLVPLPDTIGVRGVLVVVMTPGSLLFGGQAAQMLAIFVGQAAVALQLAEARREGERVVLYEDRDRIARDLHDLVIQRLFASGMQLESTTRLIEKDEAVTRIRHVVDELDSTIREIRTAIYALQTPVTSNQTSLRSKLLEITDAAAASANFTPSMQFDGPVDSAVPPEVGPQLLAVLIEALSNVARHSRAERVTVTVKVDADEVSLRVRDDGIGIGERSGIGGAGGLANLAERAARLGGAFSIAASSAPAGTELVWSVPLP